MPLPSPAYAGSPVVVGASVRPRPMLERLGQAPEEVGPTAYPLVGASGLRAFSNIAHVGTRWRRLGVPDCRSYDRSVPRSQHDSAELRTLLTVEEAARLLRVGRSRAYEMAKEYQYTDGAAGMPVIRFGPGCLRVPRWALMELATTGRVARLRDAPVPEVQGPIEHK